MPDKKQSCKTCKSRHVPPTGKKCQFKNIMESDKSVSNGLRDAAASSNQLDTDQADLGGQQLQMEILAQLQKVSQQLEMVEDQVADTSQQAVQDSAASPHSGKLSTDSVIFSTQKSSKRSKRFKPPIVTSSSSSDDSDSETPSLERLRSHALQKKVDQRIRDLDHSSHLSGTDSKAKHKSKRGGNVEVSVKRFPGPMNPFWVGSARRECRMISYPSPSGCRDFVRMFLSKNTLNEEI